MLLQILSVYDSKVSAWMPPFFHQSIGGALRSFGDTVADQNTVLNKHPADFTLFSLGTWDDASNLFTLLDTPVSLGLAIEFKEPE